MITIDMNKMAAARGPREEHDPSSAENVRVQKTASGTVNKHVGDSNFYSKHGIRPILDTLDQSAVSSLEPESPIKMKHMRKLHDGSTKFPKLAECAHFHYDFTELGQVMVSICEDNQENFHHQAEPPPGEIVFYLTVASNERTWLIRRTHHDFKTFDKQLHKCIYDRKFSLLPDLRRNEKDVAHDGMLALRKLLSLYLKRFSSIAGNMINCGPVLSWLEMDNRGNRLMVTDDSEINTPAISAGHVIKRYTGQAPDELTIQVGDIISIIDMPPGEETAWWRGKNQYQVGFFPCECVELISDKSIPQSMEGIVPDIATKPVLRRRGKLISFLRAFFSSRPAKAQLQRTGIVKQRIFGCDLGEHLSNLGLEVPKVLTSCAVVIEEHGIVDGIYRLSGVASNIQKLRNDFDEDKSPCLTDEVYLQDIHSISSLLKAYFRELPNPLLTYQLYDRFSEAVAIEEHKLLKIHDVIQQLPPPHYRTAEHLFKHLNRVSKAGNKTGMHCKNLAIVWAPNLMRSKELESMCNTAMLQGVGVQAIVTEFLIQYADVIFSDKLQSVPNDTGSVGRRPRPKSLAISTPTKLLSLEEAREQMLTGNDSPKQKYIEVGGGPNNLPKDFHTVIHLPNKKKRGKDRRQPAMSREPSVPQGTGWKSLFSRKKQDSIKSTSDARVVTPVLEPEVNKHRKLRTVRSADSLLSSSSSPGEKAKASGKLGKDEDFPLVHPKALQKGYDSRRTRSYDFAHSESDHSDQEAMLVSMEADMVARPASASAELSGPVDFHSEMEHSASVKTKVKKGKSGKDMKKSKKKQRSVSAGQPIEGIPAPTSVSLHSRSKSTSHTEQPYTEPGPAPALPPPPSPSLKERLVQALTPTSPRKRIKGPAPSPPQSPPPTLPQTSKRAAVGKSKSLPKNLPTVNQQLLNHSMPQRLTDVADNEADEAGYSRQVESSHYNQLSPIEEALYSDKSSTPDVEQQVLAAKLQHSHLQAWSGVQSQPGAASSCGTLTDEEVFQDTLQRASHGTEYSSNSTEYPPHIPQPMPRPVSSGQPVDTAHHRYGQSVRHTVTEPYTDTGHLLDTEASSGGEMSMSLDSLLKQVVGSDTYHNEFGSSASFKTFGKGSESNLPDSSAGTWEPSAQPVHTRSKEEKDSTRTWESTAQTLHTHTKEHSGGTWHTDSTQTWEPTAQAVYTHSKEHSDSGGVTWESTAQPRQLEHSPHHQASSVAYTEGSTFSQPGHYEQEIRPGSTDHEDRFERVEESPVTDRLPPTPTSSVLETDLDTCDVTADITADITADVTADTPEQFLAPEERITVHRQSAESVSTADMERVDFVAPLPGDIRMMSHYPDLIPHHALPQIDLQDSDVQYVHPHALPAGESVPAAEDLPPPCDVLSSPHTAFSQPEPMVSPTLSSPDLPTSPVLTDQTRDFGLQSERGQVVVRRPLEDAVEGGTYIPVKTRVVPPPRQFAYSAPPVADPEEGSGLQPARGEVVHTAIDTPSDEFPSPPPHTDFFYTTDSHYLPDNSQPSPPGFLPTEESFELNLKTGASEPLSIGEQDEEVAMVISPTCSVSKTPESDSLMVTSSVDSEHEVCGLDVEAPEGGEQMESELVFEMEDVKSLSKSIESLQNLSMSSEEATLQDRDLVIREGEPTQYSIEHTDSQVDYYFSYDKSLPEEPVAEQSSEEFSEVLGKFSSISNEALVSTITVEAGPQQDKDVSGSCPPEAAEYHPEPVGSQTNPADHAPQPTETLPTAIDTQMVTEMLQVKESESRDKKPTPVRRKKSVKELLSRFEVGGSPPSDQEGKGRPQVFQKPRVVRLHSLTKSSDTEEGVQEESRPRQTPSAMSVSCPDTSRLMSLSPRSIDLEQEGAPQETTHTFHHRQPPAVSKKPSVRNKVHRFESTDSLTSDTEQSKSVSPVRRTSRENSPNKMEEHKKMKNRAFSPIPPAKPVIIHEKTSPAKTDSRTVSLKTASTTASKEEALYAFPPSQKSESSPKFSRKSFGVSDSKCSTSFQLRSASAGVHKDSKLLVREDSSEGRSQGLTDRMRCFQGEEQGASPEREDTKSSRASGNYHNRRASVEPQQANATSPSVDKAESTPLTHTNYKRSSSLPNNAFASGLSLKSTVDIPMETEENVVLKPSDFPGRKTRKQTESSSGLSQSLSTQNTSKSDTEDHSMMSTSFSDRRRLFESPTDSGVVSVSGSVRRGEVKACVEDAPSPPHIDSDYAARVRQFGQKTVVIESSDKPAPHKLTTSAAHTGFVGNGGRSKPYERDQKENMKPADTVFRGREAGHAGKERSATVKDLWRKFEQQSS